MLVTRRKNLTRNGRARFLSKPEQLYEEVNKVNLVNMNKNLAEVESDVSDKSQEE